MVIYMLHPQMSICDHMTYNTCICSGFCFILFCVFTDNIYHPPLFYSSVSVALLVSVWGNHYKNSSRQRVEKRGQFETCFLFLLTYVVAVKQFCLLTGNFRFGQGIFSNLPSRSQSSGNLISPDLFRQGYLSAVISFRGLYYLPGFQKLCS